jgi:hypothetical protein
MLFIISDIVYNKLVNKNRKLIGRTYHYLKFRNLIWILKDIYYRVTNSYSREKSIEQEIDFTDSIFIFTFGSRLLGNRDNILDKVFASFLEKTNNTKLFEFRIKVDDDDNLNYFSSLKKKYGKIQITFHATPRGNGYADMHLWHNQLFEKRSSSVKYHIIITDDALFSVKNWDIDLLKRIASKERETRYWIGMPNKLEDAIKVMGPNPVTPTPVYWVAGTDFPILSAALMLKIKEFTKELPDKNWTPYGNLFNIDSYFGDILKNMRIDKARVCHLEVDNYFKRTGVTSWNSYIWPGEIYKSKLRTKTLSNFFNSSSQETRTLISAYIEELV